MANLMIVESPVDQIEGETITRTVEWQGSSSVTAAQSVVYLDGDVYTSTAIPSGTSTDSGTVQTLEPLFTAAGDGGKKYVQIITATVDGNTEKRKLIINVIDASSEI